MRSIPKKARTRFWKKVKVDRETGCWIWTASVRTWKREPWDGQYGAFWLDGRVQRAHIVAYWILFGAIPRGKVLLHGCDNRRCVNVLGHIKPGTQAQNVRDMLAKGRSNHQRKNGTITIEKETPDAKEGKARQGSAGEPGAGQDGGVPVGSSSPHGGASLDRHDLGEARPEVGQRDSRDGLDDPRSSPE